MRKPISVTVDGIEYHGEYEIKGKRKLDLYVYYKDIRELDMHGYDPKKHSQEVLETMAKQILWQIVTGRTLKRR